MWTDGSPTDFLNWSGVQMGPPFAEPNDWGGCIEGQPGASKWGSCLNYREEGFIDGSGKPERYIPHSGIGEDASTIKDDGTWDDAPENGRFKIPACGMKFPLPTANATLPSLTSCWSSLTVAINDPVHIIDEQSTDRSSQGDTYFTNRFCSGWSSFITPACNPNDQSCDENSLMLGNAIADGGNDMYDTTILHLK